MRKYRTSLSLCDGFQDVLEQVLGCTRQELEASSHNGKVLSIYGIKLAIGGL
jgi:hypothetical protein